MQLLELNKVHLLGIKGVGMTALAQMLIDAGLTVTGSDVAEEFVTQPILNQLPITITSQDDDLPMGCQGLICSSAHQLIGNALFSQAQSRQLPTWSHAKAVAELLNHKHLIAVCGVGGKSTISAMLSWVLTQHSQTSSSFTPSFAVGVGKIPGLNKTGQWSMESNLAVVEADEYADNPFLVHRGEELVPRFSYLQPNSIICTGIAFDHPDVYQDFEHTKRVFSSFFNQLKPGGQLLINGDDALLVQLATKLNRDDIKIQLVGTNTNCDWQLSELDFEKEVSTAQLSSQNNTHQLKLQIPGDHYLLDAALATAALTPHLLPEITLQHLQDFQSTGRRWEKLPTINGAVIIDDYAHHPREIRTNLKALNTVYPGKHKIVIFQPHTYSRTEELITDFVTSFAQADQLLLLPIFSSARETQPDKDVNAIFAQKLQSIYRDKTILTLKSITETADWLKSHLDSNSVAITMGAGDVYKVWELIDDT